MNARVGVALGLAFFLGSGGCAPVDDRDHHRLEAALDRDGYALFKVAPGDADRAAVLVEMRDAPPGTYVLLHSLEPPESIGWFSLDIDAYAPCRRYGDDAVDRVELDCLVPDGRGEVVDVILVETPMLLPPRTGAARRSGPSTSMLRHDICACEGCQCSSEPSSAARARSRAPEYYAVMRVERFEAATRNVPFAIEVRSLDAKGARMSADDAPWVAQLQ